MTEIKTNAIPHRLKNVNKEHPYVSGARDIYDDAKGKSQAEVNADVDDTFALHQSEINALDSQNYVTVDTFGELPATGAADTVYRVANYDGTQVVTNKYAEYAWNGTQYKLLDVKEYGIDDVPTAGSDNLVKSGGVKRSVDNITGFLDFLVVDGSGINASGAISSITGAKRSDYIDITGLTCFYITNPNNVALDYNVFYDSSKVFINGSKFTIPANAKYYKVTIPSTAKYSIVSVRNNGDMPILWSDGGTEESKIYIRELQENTIKDDYPVNGSDNVAKSKTVNALKGIYAKDKIVSEVLAGSRVGIAIPIDDLTKTYHLKVVNQSDNVTRPISVALLNGIGVTSGYIVQKVVDSDENSFFETDISIASEYRATAKYIGIFFESTSSSSGGWKFKMNLYAKESVAWNENSINEITSDVADIRGIVGGDIPPVVYIRTDGKTIGGNPGIDNYGKWASISMKSYSDYRTDPILGTNYVAKVYDTRNYVGKTLNLYNAPRNNAFRYVFVTDYTQITTSTTSEVWNSIYVEGQNGDGETQARHFSVVVPTNGNYLIIAGSNTQEATAFVKSVKQDVESLYDSIHLLGQDTDSIVNLNNVAETTNKIKNAKRLPRVSSTTQGVTPLMLLHFSDLHGNSDNLARIKEFADYYKQYIDDVLCTGDIVDSMSSDFSFWDEIGCDDYLVTIGNHEQFASLSPTTQALPADVYNQFIAPYISNWNVTTPSDAATAYKCYYYKDYSAAKVRLIVLDEYAKGEADYISEENTWLQGVLTSAKNAGLSVLIAIHTTNDGVEKFDCSFCTQQKAMGTSDIPLVFRQSVESFITEESGDFIGWIGGHGHYDVCGVDSTYNKQVVIAVDTASDGGSPTAYSDIERSSDKTNKFRDCFNLLAVDTYQKTIKVIRIGANYDSWMRKKDTMCIQYASSAANPIDAPELVYCS